MEYYWAIERNASELVLRRCKNLHCTEWSKSERERQISYINAYMEYRKMVLMNLASGQWWRHRHRDRSMDTVGKAENGTHWENSMEIYIYSDM